MSKKKYFDSYARKWDEFQHEIDSEQLEALIERFEIQKGDWVLDVGTGTGILLPYITRLIGSRGRVFALDFSSEMLSKAKSKFPDQRIKFVNADVTGIPLGDEIFNRVICFASFAHFEDQSKALKEMSRVLKKGGKLFIAHLLSSEEIREHHLEAGGVVKNDTIPSDSVMRKMMLKVKFKEIKIIDQPSLYLAQGEKG